MPETVSKYDVGTYYDKTEGLTGRAAFGFG